MRINMLHVPSAFPPNSWQKRNLLCVLTILRRCEPTYYPVQIYLVADLSSVILWDPCLVLYLITMNQLVLYVRSTHTLVIAKSSSLQLSHCAGELSPHLRRCTRQVGLTNKPHSLPCSCCGPPGPTHKPPGLYNMWPIFMSRLLCVSQTSHPGRGLHSHILSCAPSQVTVAWQAHGSLWSTGPV